MTYSVLHIDDAEKIESDGFWWRPVRKVLGTTELDGTDDTCPTVMTFDTDDQTKIYDAPPSTDDLIAFMKPFVQP